ncbi:MAG: group III truncated hemoglobin [Bacteroidota bacterium]|nr:group III truncated hemoglobin [Bacteroidota bacterium]
MENAKKDIETKADVELMVKTFYTQVVKDPEIGRFFTHVNFEEHFPRMFAFWNFILLDEAGFTGNVFDKHANLGIESEHFPVWLRHFKNTVDELFVGEKANLAKQRAELIAYTFDSKLNKK